MNWPAMDLRGLAPWAGLSTASLEDAQVVVAGIPYDGSAAYRRGAALAPAAIRRLSAAMPPVDERGRWLGGIRVCDLGDLSMGRSVETGWEAVADRLAEVPPAAFLTVIGGDHCSEVPILAAEVRRHPGLAVVWVDAHPDLDDVSRGGRWTCGCALRRALEVAGMEPETAVFLGCRDFDPEEVELIRSRGLTLVTAAELAADPAIVERAVRDLAGRPVHLSFDIDVLDPAFAPGTEIASAGGLSTRQALTLLNRLASGCRLVGLDVCEVSPPLDQADITVLAALKVVFETWACLFPGPADGDR